MQAGWSYGLQTEWPYPQQQVTRMFPTIISDGSGGAIIAWMDSRSGAHCDIYAQRINASGVVQWTADGVAISTAAGAQIESNHNKRWQRRGYYHLGGYP